MEQNSRLLGHLPISFLTGLGPVIQRRFNAMGIYTIRDLLMHLPLRYENRSNTSPIGQIVLGQPVTVKGKIVKTEIIKTRQQMLITTITDGTGVLNIRFMNFYTKMQNDLKPDRWVSVYGEVVKGKAYFEMVHPNILIRQSLQELDAEIVNTYTPIYPTSNGMHQATIRRYINTALELLKFHSEPEILPAYVSGQFPDIVETILTLHKPDLSVDVKTIEDGTHPAKKRMIVEELLATNLNMQILKKENQSYQAIPMRINNRLMKPFLNNLPFTPTNAQKRVAKEIWYDMAKSMPMMRLVQGDVGSGKTLVAAFAILMAIENNKQVVLMAPTEILAEQHYFSFKKWFEQLDITVDLLLGKSTPKMKKESYEKLESGQTQLLIGTHAVFVNRVQFADLGLVVIDEQHKFGVNQRLSLWEKGTEGQIRPHQLIMTATPIPRTLSMVAYNHIDISTINELPPGRTPIQTIVLPNFRRDEVIERIYNACQQGKQAYWVCSLIDESEHFELQAADTVYNELAEQLPDLKIGLVHGKMKSAQKQEIMQAFKNGEIQLLVSTTVIEVGVDVPNASLMVIENAERFGLSQLHQLRGRVGRGSIASHCILLFQSPISYTGRQRLNVMRDSNDGFELAQKDLEIRGGGEVFGTKQVGEIRFKMVNLLRDQHMLGKIQKVANRIMEEQPELAPIFVDFWLSNKGKFINA